MGIRYYANPSTERVRDAMRAGLLGCIATPAQGNKIPEGVDWVADNGAFSDRFDEGKWWKFLNDNAHRADTCAFAVAPDVVADAAATLERSTPWLPRIRALGYPAAFVAQDGQESLDVPWDNFDVLFVGGSTAWKLGTHAAALVAEAKARGKGVHCGRVNSQVRMRYMTHIGVDSCDGTFLAFGPDTNLPRLLSWLQDAHQQPALFGGAS